MNAYQVYEQAIKPLSAEEKTGDCPADYGDVVPDVGLQAQADGVGLNGFRTQSESETPAKARKPREFGAGRHLLSGAGIDVAELMVIPIDDMFADYMPDENQGD